MPRGAGQPTELAGRLYDQYGASLYRYALMLLADPASAEDVVQQVFASLIATMRWNTGIDNAEHYLRRAIRNQCYSTLRRSSREPARSASGGALLTSPAGIDERPDERLALEQALKTLPPEQREVVHLRVYEGMTFQEIASQTDQSINTIASRYRYALEKLKAQLT
jgi:RNA polymerase sigma-70 factor (ECF subfamily)